MPYVKTRDGTDLYVKDWGSGRPVVLLHGWPLNADSWEPQAIALANAGFRAIAYDRRGFGRSGQPWGGHDYDTYADDLKAVLEAAGATQDVALVGFSMGGGEVARYLSRHGGAGVTHAGLIGSVVPGIVQTDANPNGVPAEKLEEIAGQIKADRAKFFESFFRDFYGVGVISHPVSDAFLQESWTVAMQASLHATLEAAKAWGFTDFTPDLPAITVPTLIVHGTSDATVPIKATAHRAVDGIAANQLVEYSGAPHGLFATESDRLSTDLVTFLGG
jgi:non-heme chloroperoxidase